MNVPAPVTLIPGDAKAVQDVRPYGGFQIVLADPPWNFSGNSKAKPGKNARQHYDCMPLDEIAALPVKDVVALDALLLMWVTVPFAELAFRVLKGWGFKYKSQLVWPKSRIGTGYWARNKHELLYIARRGRFPCPGNALFPTSIIPGRSREHSRKPDWVHEVIDAQYPETQRVEIFARQPRPGWVVLGNQVNRFEGVAA
ncbi:DNA methyltransferase [Gemmobacter lutimaris]|uniref:DNA methyltransferase n=1 Tax=Gemmobacter lutimaris TaxID=2306023 RepID=A0A398BLB4_9RHOB|nr:MT-A70 family methyltransferase [Gemmobacter lutimaris]RID91202.1 DNA methyltransferase [Gemmobacter lutimaris]